MRLASVSGRLRETLAIAFAMALTSACLLERESPPPARRQAILILLDAARADRFGFAGYPRDTTPGLDAMARDGLVSLDHFAPDTHTRGSLPSLFYSRQFTKPLFPTSDAVPYAEPESLMRKLDDEAFSFVRALGNDGFATAAISAHSWLKPDTPFADQFDTLVDLAGELDRYAPPARHVVDRAQSWIEAHRNEDYFLYLHLMDTHFPHRFGSDAREFFGLDRPAPVGVDGRHGTWAGRETIDEEERRYLNALYDGSLRYADAQIARLMSYLESLDLARDTLVIVTSDHGEHLFESPGRFAHGGPWLDPVARIPLLFHYPGRLEAGRIPGYTGLVDVAPTILRLLDVPIPSGKATDGRDLIAVAGGGAPPRELAIAPLGIRSSTFKLIVRKPSSLLAEDDWDDSGISLFDLLRDPNEREDVRAHHPESLRELLTTYRERLEPRWNRFVSAKNHDQPHSSFAIGARHFETEAEHVVDVLSDQLASGSPSDGTEPRWRRSRKWNDDWIEGAAGSGGLDVSFVLPNGEYDVSARISGEGAVALDGTASTPISIAASKATGSRTSLGRIDVKGERFRIRLLAPKESGALRVHHFGFRPLGVSDQAEDSSYVEQLRALGYVR